MKKRYWLTPPEIYKKLNDEFKFDFDPCPCPRPAEYNSLIVPFGGPAAFARRAIKERDRGNTSVLILPVPWSIHLLMQADAEIRYGGQVRWLDVDTGEQCPRNAPQIIAVLKAKP